MNKALPLVIDPQNIPIEKLSKPKLVRNARNARKKTVKNPSDRIPIRDVKTGKTKKQEDDEDKANVSNVFSNIYQLIDENNKARNSAPLNSTTDFSKSYNTMSNQNFNLDDDSQDVSQDVSQEEEETPNRKLTFGDDDQNVSQNVSQKKRGRRKKKMVKEIEDYNNAPNLPMSFEPMSLSPETSVKQRRTRRTRTMSPVGNSSKRTVKSKKILQKELQENNDFAEGLKEFNAPVQEKKKTPQQQNPETTIPKRIGRPRLTEEQIEARKKAKEASKANKLSSAKKTPSNLINKSSAKKGKTK